MMDPRPLLSRHRDANRRPGQTANVSAVWPAVDRVVRWPGPPISRAQKKVGNAPPRRPAGGYAVDGVGDPTVQRPASQ